GDVAVFCTRALDLAEQLVGDVERREDGQPHRVAAGGRLAGCADFAVDEAGQPAHVLGIERAADRVALPEDFDRDALGVGPYRFNASSCVSMSLTRPRITSRSSLSAVISV